MRLPSTGSHPHSIFKIIIMFNVINEGAIQRSPKSPRSPSSGSSASGSETEKSKKYDRQLRIWGQEGQNAIENGHVCLINANATGTEILKSLVLPGLGLFTIVDGCKTSGEDVGSNFFLTKESIGKSRAKETTQLLLELNPDVRGDFIDESFESLLETNPKFFLNFNIVVFVGFCRESSLIKLAQICWEGNVPFIICKSLGFIGYIRIQVPEHTIIQSHPDYVLEDLRLDDPFNELEEHLNSCPNLDKLNRKDISHTPYLVILYKFLVKWRQIHGRPVNSLPKTSKEKQDLRKLIKEGMDSIKQAITSKSDDVNEIELENFQEAINAINKVLVPSTYIPSETQRIMDDSKVSDLMSLNVKNLNFWLKVKALKEFVAKHNCLPVRGSIPDMTSDTEKFIKLQRIYANKAKEDAETVYSCLQAICESLGKPIDCSENELLIFCKNAHNLNLIRTSQIANEYSSTAPTNNLKDLIASSGQNGDSDNDLLFYLMIRSVDRFYTSYNRFPGYIKDQVESDVVALKSCFKELLTELGSSGLAKDEILHEFCRYGGSELHSVASFVGGCAAQEIIKLITGQFIPLNNTIIYNAMLSTTITFDL